MVKLIQVFSILLLSFVLTGCEQEGPMERAGKVVDEAVEDAGEAVRSDELRIVLEVDPRVAPADGTFGLHQQPWHRLLGARSG